MPQILIAAAWPHDRQPCGSFKLRGIGATVADAAARGASTIVSSSGGNAGLAAAYAARALGLACTVVLPNSTPASVADRLRNYGAEAIFKGDHWDQANAHAEALVAARVAEEGAGAATLVHPFEGEATWDGHATLVDEVVAAPELGGAPPAGVVTVVGGGGLLLGVLRGLRRQAGDPATASPADVANWGAVPVVACETRGADSLAQSVAAGTLVTLPGIASVAKSLGAATVSPAAFAAASAPLSPVRPCVVTDAEAVAACLRFADEHRVLVEPACGAALAAVYDGHDAVREVVAEGGAPLVVQVCGGALVDRAQLAEFAAATDASA